jgi:hypothetical protein
MYILRLCCLTHLLGMTMSVSPFFTTPASLLPITTVPMSLQAGSRVRNGAGHAADLRAGAPRKHGTGCFPGQG